MSPTLESGDWLLVDPDAYIAVSIRPGDLVLAPDPRSPTRLLVKRVVAVTPNGELTVAGDNPAESTDSRSFGTVAIASVEGRPWFRYWPISRWGRVD